MSLLDSVGGLLGVSGSSLVAPIASAFSGLFNNSSAAQRQEDAQSFSAQQFANRYQTTVEDMKKAGLNPMLAYSQGGGNAPTSSAASSAGMPDVGSSYTAAKMASAQMANIEADTQNKKEQAALIRAQAAQAMSSANQADAATTKIGQEVWNLKEQFKNIPLEGNRLRAFVEQISSQIGLMDQQNLTETEKRANLRAMISKLNAETDLLNLDKQAAEDLGNIGREAGQLKPIVDILRSFIRK